MGKVIELQIPKACEKTNIVTETAVQLHQGNEWLAWLYGDFYIYEFNDNCSKASCAKLSISQKNTAALYFRNIKYQCKDIQSSWKTCSMQFISKIDVETLSIILPDLRHSYIGGLASLQRPSTGNVKFPTAYRCVVSRVPFKEPVSTFGVIVRENIPDEYRIYKIIQWEMRNIVQSKGFPKYTPQISEELGGIDCDCYMKLSAIGRHGMLSIV